MGSFLMLFAEILVAVIPRWQPLITFGASVQAHREAAGRRAACAITIVELMSATETAERAIAGLRNTLGECEKTLAERLRTAERYASESGRTGRGGREVMGRIMAAVDNNARTVDSARAPASLPAASTAAPPAKGAPHFTPASTRYTLSRIRARVRQRPPLCHPRHDGCPTGSVMLRSFWPSVR